MRRPVDAPLGDGTAEHAARGVGPAQDYKCPAGTPLVAPFEAVRVVRSGGLDAEGGYALTGHAENGDYWVMQHLSSYLNSTTAAEGDIVALSGNTGTWTTGPHLHHYVVLDGVRHNPEDIGLYAQPASGGAEPFNPTQEDTMASLPLVITVSVPDGAGQAYWSVDLAARTKGRIHNGTELDWRRNLGVPEYVNQPPQVLEGYTEIAG